MNKISYSQYSLWANCPKSWKLKYVDGHKFDDSSIHTIFGTAMHEVIQEWLQVVFEKSEAFANKMDLSENLKSKLMNLFKESTQVVDGKSVYICDKETLTEFYTQGCEIIEYIQKNRKKIFPTVNVELAGIEHEILVEVRPGVHFGGFIDIVTRNTKTGKVTIYDLKTSRTGWTDKEKSNPIKVHQILLYKKFYAEQLGIPEDNIDCEFIILKRQIYENTQFVIPRVSKFVPPNKKPSINKAWAGVEQFLNECFTETGEYNTSNIVAKPSKENCRWCIYKDRKELCGESFYK